MLCDHVTITATCFQTETNERGSAMESGQARCHDNELLRDALECGGLQVKEDRGHSAATCLLNPPEIKVIPLCACKTVLWQIHILYFLYILPNSNKFILLCSVPNSTTN